MSKLLSKLLVVCLFATSMAQAYYKSVKISEKAQNKVIGVRISDVVKFHGNITPSLKALNNTITKKASRFFGKDVKQVQNLFLNDIPKRSGNVYRLNMGAIVRTKSNSVKLVKATFTYTKDSTSKPTLVYKNEYSVDEANFNIAVSLADRRMVISSRVADVKMVFPLGVGSFDERVLNPFATSLLTPRFKTAWLDADMAMYARKKPRYFAKKPFIRVSTPENKRTGIGFHIQPMPKKNAFIRAFDSHGCMRMQESDLYMLYWLVSKKSDKRTPIVIDFQIDESMEHPFPKRNKPFKTVVNIGSKDKKQWKLDKDGLIYVANVWKRTAPVELLENSDEDHYHNVYNYKTSDFVEEYSNKCKIKAYGFVGEELVSKEKSRASKAAYKKCMKRIQTKASKLYKWWVHGK